MDIKKFENFNIESNDKAEMSRKIDKMIKEGKSSLDIIELVTHDIMADVRNKLGPVATLIDFVAILNDKEQPNDASLEYVKSKIPRQIERSYAAIEYLKDYNFDNKYTFENK